MDSGTKRRIRRRFNRLNRQNIDLADIEFPGKSLDMYASRGISFYESDHPFFVPVFTLTTPAIAILSL